MYLSLLINKILKTEHPQVLDHASYFFTDWLIFKLLSFNIFQDRQNTDRNIDQWEASIIFLSANKIQLCDREATLYTFYFYIAFEELTFYQKCSIKCVLYSLFYRKRSVNKVLRRTATSTTDRWYGLRSMKFAKNLQLTLCRCSKRRWGSATRVWRRFATRGRWGGGRRSARPTMRPPVRPGGINWQLCKYKYLFLYNGVNEI